MSGRDGGPIGRETRARQADVELEVGPAVRAWVLRLATLVAAGAAAALLGGDTFGWVVGGLAAAALVVAPRTIAPAPFVLVMAALLLREAPPEPLVLAGAVLAVHAALALASLAEALPLLTLVQVAVLRSRLPDLLLAQAVGQLLVAVTWALTAGPGRDTVVPWLAVAALVGVAGLGWALLRIFPRAGQE